MESSDKLTPRSLPHSSARTVQKTTRQFSATTQRWLPWRRFTLGIVTLCINLVALGGCGEHEHAALTTDTRDGRTAEKRQHEEIWFAEEAAKRGIDFRFDSGHEEHYYMPEIMGGGAALFDMDDDGDLDAYLLQGGSLTAAQSLRPANQLFRNDGSGYFENVTEDSGSDDQGYGMGVATGDWDNDGDADLYITNVGPNVLLRNEGSGRFQDVSAVAGVGDNAWSASTMFTDYDNDGDLDLFATRYMHWSVALERPCFSPVGEADYCYPPVYKAQAPDILYRNDGNGTFAEVSYEAGLHEAYGYGLGVVGGDFDSDGWSDIFVANDGSKNQLWVNGGDGTFTDEALLRGCALDESGMAKAGMGVDVIDVDDNNTLDLLVVNLREETNSYFRNEGDFFVDATATSGLAVGSDLLTRFGVALIDFDNDGWLDLYTANGRIALNNAPKGDRFAQPNSLFRGVPGARFQETSSAGTAQVLVATSRGAAFGDVDNDGGMDVLVVNRDAPVHLLHNVVAKQRHWISFRVLNRHGADAMEATIRLSAGRVSKRRNVKSAYSYQAANDPRIHVGLGDIDQVLDVQVRWADGELELFGDFDADQVITLRRGSGLSRQ